MNPSSHQFKFVFLFVFVFTSLQSMVTHAQTYERSRGNIGFMAGASSIATTNTGDYFSGGAGMAYEAGVTMAFYDLIYPALVYRNVSSYFNNPDRLTANVVANEMSSHTLAVPVNLRWKFWGLYTGKSKSYECKGVDISLLAGLEYNFVLNHESNMMTGPRNAFNYHYGLSFHPGRSGGAKSAQKRSLHLDVFYQAGTPNFAYTNFDGEVTEWNHRMLGVRATLLLYKVYKFSNM